MKRNHKLAGVIATAAALAFITAPITSTLAQAGHSSKVQCEGVNSCKGKGSCKTANNSCKGQNSCKGKGVKMMKNAARCKKAGGTVVEPTPAS